MSMERAGFLDPALLSQTPDARRKIFTSKIETLPKLHVFVQAIGLGDFGKPGNYFARQVDRWTKQYRLRDAAHPGFRNSPNGCPKPCRSRNAFRSFMAIIATTT
jgi:hypothetical protein